MIKKIFFLFIVIIISLSAMSIEAAAPLNIKTIDNVFKSFDIKKDFYELDVFVTAYSSDPNETDETPFITALGTWVRDGIVAANFLPFGTKIKIPDVFGDKIFIVEDRMHKRKNNFIDIWMSSKEKALNFGIVKTKIQIFFD